MIALYKNFFLLFLVTAIASCFGQDNCLFEQRFANPLIDTLRIEAELGRIVVRPSPNNELYLRVMANVAAAKCMRVHCYKRESRIILAAQPRYKSSLKWAFDMHLSYEILLPKQLNLQICSEAAHIDVANINSSISIKSTGGDLTIGHSCGLLSLDITGGNLVLDHFYGPCRIQSSGCNLGITAFEGTFQAALQGCNLALEAANTPIEVLLWGGDIELDYFGENRGIFLQTTGGNILAHVPSQIKANLQCFSQISRVECQIPTTCVKASTKHQLVAELGHGGAPFTCQSRDGGIVITPLVE